MTPDLGLSAWLAAKRTRVAGRMAGSTSTSKNCRLADNQQMAQLENFRLKVFRVVAEQLNFRKAAENLFLTQPAVTLQIKALENDLGVRLFDRTTGKISLTRQGSVLLTYA